MGVITQPSERWQNRARLYMNIWRDRWNFLSKLLGSSLLILGWDFTQSSKNLSLQMILTSLITQRIKYWISSRFRSLNVFSFVSIQKSLEAFQKSKKIPYYIVELLRKNFLKPQKQVMIQCQMPKKCPATRFDALPDELPDRLSMKISGMSTEKEIPIISCLISCSIKSDKWHNNIWVLKETIIMISFCFKSKKADVWHKKTWQCNRQRTNLFLPEILKVPV